MHRFSLLPTVAAVPALADIIFENELIKTEEIFDLEYAKDSNVWAYENDGLNQTKYYCVFRNNWTPKNHPAEYPELARWGTPAIFSHTKQYAPYLKNRAAPIGIQQIAEVSFERIESVPTFTETLLLTLLSSFQHGFTSVFDQEIIQAGIKVQDTAKGENFFINQELWDQNYVYLPPLKVSLEHNFISGLSGMGPSPDWFTQFYLFDVIKEQGQVYWESFNIRTYPWDAGTDDGEHFTSSDRDSFPKKFVTRITVDNAQHDIFLSPSGNEVKHVAEWECIRHTCDVDDDDCKKPDWPPANGCDILKFPQCAEVCDPNVEECEQCKRVNESEPKVFRKSCCEAGRIPKKGGTCDVDSKSKVSGAFATLVASSLGIAVAACLFV